MVDQLSEALDLVRIRGVVSGGFAARGRWVARAPVEDALKLTAMVYGRSRLSADGLDAPVVLESGDVAILNNRSWLELEGGAGDGAPREIRLEENFSRLADADRHHDDVVLGISVDLDPAGRALLLRGLPPVGHIRASAATTPQLRGNLDRLFDEVSGNHMGSAFAIRQYGQLLLLDILRAYVDQTELPAGWLRLLTDVRLRPALNLMHTDPGHRWGLQDLAGAAAMSRTSFAEHFRAVAGQPPLTYLNGWRMLLAQRALRDDDVRVGELATKLGYASESAFSTAFKREMGESPLRFRQRARQDRPS